MAKTSSAVGGDDRTPVRAGGPGRGAEPFLGTDRGDRILGAVFLGVMLLSVISFFVLLIGDLVGLLGASSTVLTAVLLAIPFAGLPLAIVLLIVLMLRMARRRRLANRRD